LITLFGKTVSHDRPKGINDDIAFPLFFPFFLNLLHGLSFFLLWPLTPNFRCRQAPVDPVAKPQ
jgi:hypothetical protein